MGDISHGPVSTLAGSLHAMPDDAMCDVHPERKAVARIQGETDSFGCEYEDVCAECLKEIRDYRNSPEAKAGTCDWCHKQAADLRDRRDMDEGMSGRVYRVCGACVKRDNDRLEEEAREFGYYDDYWEPDDDFDYEPSPPPKIKSRRPKKQKAVAKITCKACHEPWALGHVCKRRKHMVRMRVVCEK